MGDVALQCGHNASAKPLGSSGTRRTVLSCPSGAEGRGLDTPMLISLGRTHDLELRAVNSRTSGLWECKSVPERKSRQFTTIGLSLVQAIFSFISEVELGGFCIISFCLAPA